RTHALAIGPPVCRHEANSGDQCSHREGRGRKEAGAEPARAPRLFLGALPLRLGSPCLFLRQRPGLGELPLLERLPLARLPLPVPQRKTGIEEAASQLVHLGPVACAPPLGFGQARAAVEDALLLPLFAPLAGCLTEPAVNEQTLPVLVDPAPESRPAPD